MMEERERAEEYLKEEKKEFEKEIQRLETTVKANEVKVQHMQWKLEKMRGKS